MGLFETKRFVLFALVALGIAACGRAGPLEPPPASATSTPATAEETPVEDRPFILDALL
ncbi:LPS translocon maturation chaperone LptM [Oricola cellulosilytica]|uniref:LPS translocon maturation chaperone LptM n=1 Tax=Oricola cellulosilytica TaxID=1429082 RepID=UPI0018EE7AC3|nr:lipoprotein [Oricola cellulosilytica]